MTECIDISVHFHVCVLVFVVEFSCDRVCVSVSVIKYTCLCVCLSVHACSCANLCEFAYMCVSVC